MLANFLPLIMDRDSDASFVESQSALSHDLTGVDECLPDTDLEDNRERVKDWVTSLPCTEDNVSAIASIEAPSTVKSPVLSQTHREQTASSEDTDQLSDDKSESAKSVIVDHANSHEPQAKTVSSSSVHEIRSRVGRIVKPVNRLICAMSQKVADRNSYDTVDKFAKSIFQVLR